MNKELQMRLFTLDWRLEDLEDLQEIGRQNFQTSIEKEPGTFFMAMGAEKEQPERTYVIEIYADENAYKTHAASQHFQAFASFAVDHLQGRQVVNLTPEVLVEKEGGLSLLQASNQQLRIEHLTIKENQIAAFKGVVAKEMKQSIKLEEGVQLLFAASVTEQPDEWIFIELYQDQEAYDKHRETSHFKTYIQKTKDMVLDKRLQVLTPQLVVSRGTF
ncbi:putative quinol monooxygenase [Streptococcus cristatus]|uniref:ABM domain-containing protein n=1 Tax=Streptococcus cristatus TaxID=45634 RepID=A0A139N4E8_STRCR|nr:antibiotic biosynthesis monooxygenase [Streptococcus cristatus]KXT70909.1 hypothetical protein SCRDD08_00343 [Streptococcus cristatus]